MDTNEVFLSTNDDFLRVKRNKETERKKLARMRLIV